jgi:hypothetical protein
MSGWTSEELARIAVADELKLASVEPMFTCDVRVNEDVGVNEGAKEL